MNREAGLDQLPMSHKKDLPSISLKINFMIIYTERFSLKRQVK